MKPRKWTGDEKIAIAMGGFEGTSAFKLYSFCIVARLKQAKQEKIIAVASTEILPKYLIITCKIL